jgi:hypothetical protein
MKSLFIFFILALGFSSCIEKRGRYDCTSHKVSVYQKSLDPKPKKNESGLEYYLIMVDEESNFYRVKCTKEEYQFTHIGEHKTLLICQVIPEANPVRHGK